MLISAIGSIAQCRGFISCDEVELQNYFILAAFDVPNFFMIKNLGNQFTLVNLKIVLISQNFHCTL